MFAKLFSRITESSLMEESVQVRYTFVMMLAIADPEGYVIGTDVAIARRINVPLGNFEDSISVLMAPDPHSNSKEFEGRRIIISNCERGYHVVNYVNYRDTKDPIERRKYMRDYMQKRRSKNDQLTHVNFGKPILTHATAEAEAEAEEQTTIKEKGNSAKSPFLQNQEFAGVAAAFRKARTAKHGAVSEEVVEAWYYDLNRFPVDEAIEILRFSTACEAKKPITNGDHKAKPPPERNGKPKTKTDEVNDIIKRTFANGK